MPFIGIVMSKNELILTPSGCVRNLQPCVVKLKLPKHAPKSLKKRWNNLKVSTAKRMQILKNYNRVPSYSKNNLKKQKQTLKKLVTSKYWFHFQCMHYADILDTFLVTAKLIYVQSNWKRKKSSLSKKCKSGKRRMLKSKPSTKKSEMSLMDWKVNSKAFNHNTHILFPLLLLFFPCRLPVRQPLFTIKRNMSNLRIIVLLLLLEYHPMS